jgi:GTP-binding protein
MVVGEHSRPIDLQVHITKEKKVSTVEGGPPAPAPRLIPARSMSLERALEFLADDEVVEVTPRALRIRKRVLGSSRRGRKA